MLGSSLNKYLVVIDKDSKKNSFLVSLGIASKSSNLYDFKSIILEKNPDVLVGR